MSGMFSHITVGSMTLENRCIRSATHEWMADDEGFPEERYYALYERLAGGDIGLIITGFSYIHPDGKCSPKQQGIYDDRFIDGYRRLTDMIHAAGNSKVALQIVHGGRQSRPELVEDPIAPSAVSCRVTKTKPRAMTLEEIAEVKDAFVLAIRRAKDAGFDAAQLHIAHGYLLSQFISPHINRRTDVYGGSTENRTRIIVEILRDAREAVGSDYPIIAKLNSEDGFKTRGLQMDEAVKVAKMLEDARLDMIEVSGGIVEAGRKTARMDILERDQEAYFADNAAQIKKPVSIPVAVVGGIRSMEVINRILGELKADMVAMARAFIREPDIVRKFKNGESTVAACISCNGCFNPDGVRCAIVD